MARYQTQGCLRKLMCTGLCRLEVVRGMRTGSYLAPKPFFAAHSSDRALCSCSSPPHYDCLIVCGVDTVRMLPRNDLQCIRSGGDYQQA